MKISSRPYSLPPQLRPDLTRVLAYWESLKRRGAEMPFWDDFHLTALPDLSVRLMLIDVFDKPLRFRIGILGEELKDRYGGDLAGRFLDEIEARHPLDYLTSQSSATVESRAPTYYRHDLIELTGVNAGENYSRLLLPMWGDGHIGMLLGGVAWG